MKGVGKSVSTASSFNCPCSLLETLNLSELYADAKWCEESIKVSAWAAGTLRFIGYWNNVYLTFVSLLNLTLKQSSISSI